MHLTVFIEEPECVVIICLLTLRDVAGKSAGMWKDKISSSLVREIEMYRLSGRKSALKTDNSAAGQDFFRHLFIRRFVKPANYHKTCSYFIDKHQSSFYIFIQNFQIHFNINHGLNHVSLNWWLPFRYFLVQCVRSMILDIATVQDTYFQISSNRINVFVL